MGQTLDYIGIILPALMRGLSTSLIVFLLTLVISLPLGLGVSLGAMSRFRPLRWLVNTYIWVFRGTPLMLQLFFFHFFLPVLLGIRMERLQTAVITFGLNYAAYFAEIFRAGIQSIDRGQREAAKSLGFAPGQTMSLIIIPQAVRRIIPPVSNEVITLVKDTALVHVIGVPDLMKSARDAVNRDVNATSYLIAAIIYLLLTFFLTLLSKHLEKRFSKHERKDHV